jgi:F-type H+-transporting ATPase subunit a
MVEIISNLIRPITLSVRLIANITSGHLILGLIRSCFPSLNFLRLIVLLPFFLLLLLEFGVCFIQAYVYVALETLYSLEIIK